MGCVYTLGHQPGSTVVNNVCHDVQSYNYGGWGYYTDEGSRDELFTRNIATRTKCSGHHQHYGTDNNLTNNLYYDVNQGDRPSPGRKEIIMKDCDAAIRASTHSRPDSCHPQKAPNASNDRCCCFPSEPGAPDCDDGKCSSFTFERNAVLQPAGYNGSLLATTFSHGLDNFTFRYNDWYKVSDPSGTTKLFNTGWSDSAGASNFAEWQQKGRDAGSVYADPQLNTTDWALAPSSPARKLGFVPIDVSAVGPRPAKVGAHACAVVPSNVRTAVGPQLFTAQQSLYTAAGSGATRLSTLDTKLPQSASQLKTDDGLAHPRSCPDEWLALCPGEPCTPLTTPYPSAEVISFHADFPALSWKYYNLSIITTIIARDTSSNLTELACWAHKHNTRVVLTRFNDNNHLQLLTNATYQREWVTSNVEAVAATTPWVDGINVDLEDFPRDPSTFNMSALTSVICDTQAALHAKGLRLHSQDVAPWGSYGDFNLTALSECMDFVLPMGYCDPQSGTIAGPTIQLDVLQNEFLHHQDKRSNPSRRIWEIKPEKIILGLPFFGYNFICTNPAPDPFPPPSEWRAGAALQDPQQVPYDGPRRLHAVVQVTGDYQWP